MLSYADSAKPNERHVDASRDRLGGVLYQEQDGRLRPVVYVSLSLTPSEKNYPIHKLEFLALKWAVVDKLKDYLYGAKFVMKMDINPLTYLLTYTKLDVTGHRWLAELAGFLLSLKYRPGAGNRRRFVSQASLASKRTRRLDLCDNGRYAGLVLRYGPMAEGDSRS